MTRRIKTLVSRYLCLHMRGLAGTLDVFCPSLMSLLGWGFVTIYMRRLLPGDGASVWAALLFGCISWEIVCRSHQSVVQALTEELLTRNLLNLLMTPLRAWEWFVAVCLYSLIKAIAVTALLLALAAWFYRFHPSALGLHSVPFVMNLLLMGWAFGFLAAALVLFWGRRVQMLAWAVPMVLLPFSAIYYPLSIYPDWLKPVCLLLPSTYVMEGMRALLQEGACPWDRSLLPLGLNVVYLAGGVLLCAHMLERCRRNGQLSRMTR